MFGLVVVKPEARQASIAEHVAPFRVSVHVNQKVPAVGRRRNVLDKQIVQAVVGVAICQRKIQRALVEWLCLLVLLLRVQNKAQEPQQVGPVRLDGDGAAQLLLGLIESSLLECGRGLGINVARFGLGQRSRASRA